MAATETWTLDGIVLTSGNFNILELNVDPPKARMDWISAADSESAALMRQPLYENRKVTMKMRVSQQASMNAALDQVGAIRDKLRLASATEDGVALVWTPANSTRTVTFTVLAGEIPELPIGLSDQAYSWFSQRPVFTLELTCEPYWYGTETLTSTASSSTPFVTLEVANVTGDVPALGRLIVTDTATQARRHLEWGLESQYYNSGTSLLVDSDNMTVTGFAGTQTTKTGAYDPNATGNNAIVVTPSFSAVAMASTGNLSHVGTFKVKARMWCPPLSIATSTTSATQVTGAVRLSWAPGSQPMTANGWVSPVVGGRWEEMDLGYITIPPTIIGTQRWVGQVEIQGFVDPTTGAADTAWLDYLELIPVAEGYGVARAEATYTPAGSLSARDDFTGTTAGGALNARVAPLGGTWATSGDATDFVFADYGGGESASRAATGATNGRFGVLGATNYTDVEVAALITQTASNSSTQGVLARYVDANNHLKFTASGIGIAIDMYVAGVFTRLAVSTAFKIVANATYYLRLVAYASGRAIGTVTTLSGSPLAVLDATNAAIATGGALATGKSGIWDANQTAVAATRYYDVFGVSIPAAEPPVIYAGRSLQVRSDDTLRLDSTGTYYGRPPSYRGSRFLVPPGTSRVFAKARRNDVGAQEDANVTDATQIQIGWTPRGLVVPR